MPGCGKEEFLRVADEHGFSIIRMGDVVREEAAKRGTGTSDEAIGGFAHAEREGRGFGIWAGGTLPGVRGEGVVIEGVRGAMVGSGELSTRLIFPSATPRETSRRRVDSFTVTTRKKQGRDELP